MLSMIHDGRSVPAVKISIFEFSPILKRLNISVYIQTKISKRYIFGWSVKKIITSAIVDMISLMFTSYLKIKVLL